MNEGHAVPYGGADARARLLEQVIAAEREADRESKRREGEREEAWPGASEIEGPLALWWNLVEGRWRFIECFETGGRRYYVAFENRPGPSTATALSPRERSLLALLGSGQSEKSARYALGVGPSAVSRLLKATLAKLGLRSRTELVLFMRAVGLSEEQMASGPISPRH